MTDTENTKRTLGNVLGLRNKQAPLPANVVTKEEMEEEGFVRGWNALREARAQLAETTSTLKALQHEYSTFRTDAAREMMAMKTEADTKVMNVSAANDALRSQLHETGEKLQHYSSWSHEMEGRCEAFERIFEGGLASIHDHGEHVTVGMMSVVNNVTATLNDSAKHLSDGLVKQIKNVVTDLREQLDDMKRKRGQRGFRPVGPPPKPHLEEEKLTPEEQATQDRIVARFGFPNNDEKLADQDEATS
jgi:molecular chaperone GrpE (heat shock protein)